MPELNDGHDQYPIMLKFDYYASMINYNLNKLYRKAGFQKKKIAIQRRLGGTILAIGALISMSLTIQYVNMAGKNNYQHQHDKIENFVYNWLGTKNYTTNYHDMAEKLSVYIGNVNYGSLDTPIQTLVDQVKLSLKLWDDMDEIYPGSSSLPEYQPISYQDRDISKFVQDMNGKVNYINDREFDLTIDIGYQVYKHGSMKQIINKAVNIPILQKRYLTSPNAKHCRLNMHGYYYPETKECRFYLQARKICLVIDQLDENFGLIEDYEKFKCDYLKKEKEGFVMYNYLRWHNDSKIPSIKSLT